MVRALLKMGITTEASCGEIMKLNSQKAFNFHKNDYFHFLPVRPYQALIYLILHAISLFGHYGTFLGSIRHHTTPEIGQNTNSTSMICGIGLTMNTFFKIPWIDYFCQKDFRNTIRHSFVLYLAIAMLAVPAALCNQQHQVMVFKIPTVDLIPDPPITSYEHSSRLQDDQRPPAVAEKPSATEAGTTKITTSRKAIPFHEHIMQAAESYEVDPALIRAVIFAESNFNPLAVSHRGAQGLMQLMPSTARWLGVEDSFDPAMNIDGGVRYLRQLLDRFDGDVELALAAYNAGSRYVRKYRGIPPFKATQLYIKKVLKYQKKYQAEMASGTTVPDPAV